MFEWMIFGKREFGQHLKEVFGKEISGRKVFEKEIMGQPQHCEHPSPGISGVGASE